MMEIITLLFEIFDETSNNELIRSPTTQTYLNQVSGEVDSVHIQPMELPYPYRSTGELVRKLLHNPVDEVLENQHEFIKVAKRPRVYKLFLSELYEIQRDFFWYVYRTL